MKPNVSVFVCAIMLIWLFVFCCLCPFSLRSLHQSSAVTSLLMTSSSSPAPGTRRLRSMKSSTELWLAKRVNLIIRGGGAMAPACTNDCTEHQWTRKQETLYCVLYCFVYVRGRVEKEKHGDTVTSLERINCKMFLMLWERWLVYSSKELLLFLSLCFPFFNKIKPL